ncbi:MAG: hypothetical protein KGH50_03950 [Candidatus Micrarchaeota archaeon]|nr:hypothetical protein [Candidatus Micrarchaeota archaeon]
MANKTTQSHASALQSLKAARREDAERASDALFRVRRGSTRMGVEDVTADYLYRLFVSRQFSRRIGISLRNTERLGVESGFLAFRQSDSQFTRLTKPEKGTHEEINFDLLKHEGGFARMFGSQFIQIAAFHTHPKRHVAVPSIGDMENAISQRPSFDPYPHRSGITIRAFTIEMISIQSAKGAEMLAFQKDPRTGRPDEEMRSELERLNYELSGQEPEKRRCGRHNGELQLQGDGCRYKRRRRHQKRRCRGACAEIRIQALDIDCHPLKLFRTEHPGGSSIGAGAHQNNENSLLNVLF